MAVNYFDDCSDVFESLKMRSNVLFFKPRDLGYFDSMCRISIASLSLVLLVLIYSSKAPIVLKYVFSLRGSIPLLAASKYLTSSSFIASSLCFGKSVLLLWDFRLYLIYFISVFLVLLCGFGRSSCIGVIWEWFKRQGKN